MSASPHDAPRPCVLSTFTGAGGLDVGLEAAGFTTLGCLEIDATARETIAINRPSWQLLQPSDVLTAGRSLAPQVLGLSAGDLDLLAGGPPCQPFSKAAQWSSRSRHGLADDRGQGVVGMLDLLERFLPRALLIENVPGFLTGPVSAKQLIERRLRQVNIVTGSRYHLQHWTIDAADYGVPQARKRVIAVAFRDGGEFRLPSPTHVGQPCRAWDALHDLSEPEDTPKLDGWRTLLPSIPEGGNYQYLTDRGEGEALFGYRTRYWSFLLKLAKDRPSWTLAASPGPNTGPFHWNNRPLTARERMRLQTFPDDWSLCGAERVQTRLVGNATPPLLAEVVGRAILENLNLGYRQHMGELPRLRIGRGPQPPPPRPPAPVPDHYKSLIGTHAAHPGTGQGPSPRLPPALARE